MDYIVVSGDFISDFPLHKLIEFHRSKPNATLTLMLTDNSSTAAFVPGPKTRRSIGNIRLNPVIYFFVDVDFTAIDRKTNRILMMIAKEDVDEKLMLSSELIKK